jgi:hypothetical protein
MASIERTAYPQFKRNPVVREWVPAYTPTDLEMDFIVKHARQPRHRLTLVLLLKGFQRLKYFPAWTISRRKSCAMLVRRCNFA